MIKQKIGACLDCPEGSKEKPLTAKRCQYHYKIYRYEANKWKQEKRAELNGFLAPKKNPKPIKKMSEKRKKENKEYLIKRLQFLSLPENQKCPVTGERATEIHHAYSGANRSRFYLDETTWMAVSRKGHLWIHANPVEARELNYLKSY